MSKEKLFFSFLLSLLLILTSFFLSFQDKPIYNELLVFINDPINSLPVLASKFTLNSLTEYFNAKGIKIYTEYPLSIDAAFKISRDKDLRYLMEIKSNLLSFSRSSSGYYAKLDVFIFLYELDNPTPKLSSNETGISENSLSADISFAYALYDGSLKAIYKIEKDLLIILKK